MLKLCTAFDGMRRLAQGPLPEVALAVKAALARDPSRSILTFEDATGAVIDLDLRGSDAETLARLSPPPAPEPPAGRGRPKLGVVAREVTLLPRHWEWLGAQRGGASNALRRLIDEARKAEEGTGDARRAREAAYRFMSAIAGDLPGFEEASRALFAGNRDRFSEETAGWPRDIQAYIHEIAWGPLPKRVVNT
jgi:hypothetical protein